MGKKKTCTGTSGSRETLTQDLRAGYLSKVTVSGDEDATSPIPRQTLQWSLSPAHGLARPSVEFAAAAVVAGEVEAVARLAYLYNSLWRSSACEEKSTDGDIRGAI